MLVVQAISFVHHLPLLSLFRTYGNVWKVAGTFKYFTFRASDIAEAANVALNNIRQRQRFQDSLFRKGVFVKKKTSAFASQRFKQTNRFSSQQGLQALTALETSQQLRNAFKLDKDQGRFALPQFSLKGSRISDTCPVAPTRCVKDAKYRTVDGTCNNKDHPEWGQSNIQLQRLLPPEYEDGVESPRPQL